MSISDMLAMLGTGGTPFEVMSTLCTVLAIDQTQLVPLDAVGDVMKSLVPFLANDGDLSALSCRAMATVVERSPMNFSRNAKCMETLQAILASINPSCKVNTTAVGKAVACSLAFQQTSEGEWAEDVARLILVVLNSPDDALRVVADPAALALGVTNILQLSKVSPRAQSKVLATLLKILHAWPAGQAQATPGKGRKSAGGRVSKNASPKPVTSISLESVHDITLNILRETSNLAAAAFGNAEEELFLRTCECVLFFAQRKGGSFISQAAVLLVIGPLLDHIAVAEGVADGSEKNSTGALTLRSHIALATLHAYLIADGLDNAMLCNFVSGGSTSSASVTAQLHKVLPALVQVGLGVSLPEEGAPSARAEAATGSIVPVALLQPIDPFPKQQGGGGGAGAGGFGGGGAHGGGFGGGAPRIVRTGASPGAGPVGPQSARLAVGGHWSLPPIQRLVLAFLQLSMPHHTYTGAPTTFDSSYFHINTLKAKHRWQWLEGEMFKTFDEVNSEPITSCYLNKATSSKPLNFLSRHHTVNYQVMMQVNAQTPARSREVRFQPVPSELAVTAAAKTPGGCKQLTTEAPVLPSSDSTASVKLGVVIKILLAYHQECTSTNKELLPVVRTTLLQVLDSLAVKAGALAETFKSAASLELLVSVLQQMIKEGDVNAKSISQLLLFVTRSDQAEAPLWTTALQTAGFHATLLEQEPTAAVDEVEAEAPAPKKRRTGAKTAKVDKKPLSPLAVLYRRLVGGDAGLSLGDAALDKEPAALTFRAVTEFIVGSSADALYTFLYGVSEAYAKDFMRCALASVEVEEEEDDAPMNPGFVEKSQKKLFVCLQKIALDSATAAKEDVRSLPASAQYINSQTGAKVAAAAPTKKRGRAGKAAAGGGGASAAAHSFHMLGGSALSSVVKLSVCTATKTKILKCPKGHQLAPHHSVIWTCNKCHLHQESASLACRKCDYDLCASCSGSQPLMLSTSPLATVGQFLQEVVSGNSRRRPAMMEMLMAQLGGEGLLEGGRLVLPAGVETATLKRVPLQLTIDGTPLPSGLPVASAILQALQANKIDAQGSGAIDLLRDLVHHGPYPTFDVGGVDPVLLHCFADSSSPACRCGSVARAKFTDATPGPKPVISTLPPILMVAAEAAEAPGIQRRMQQGSEHLVAAMRTSLVDHAACVALFQQEGLPLWTQGFAEFPLRRFLPIEFRREVAKFVHFGAWRSMIETLSAMHGHMPGQVDLDLSEKGSRIRSTVNRGDLSKARGIHEVLPALRNKLELSFDGEAGTGEGPTQEFYAEAAASIVTNHKDMWRLSDEGLVPGEPFPSGKGEVIHFHAIGACAARALVDGYWSSLRFHQSTWGALSTFLGMPLHACTNGVALAQDLDPSLKKQFTQMRLMPEAQIPSLQLSMGDSLGIGVEEEEDDDAPCEIIGTHTQLSEYMANMAQSAILQPSKPALEHLTAGLAVYLSPRTFLQTFESHEVNTVFCGLSGDDAGPRFTASDLRNSIVGSHGYTSDSEEVKRFIEVLVSFTPKEQTYFVEWLTGSTQLPPGGLASLGKPITVVKKDMSDRHERMLPSCNTCFLYVKLPSYSSVAILKERLLLAVAEGRRNFALS